MTVKTIIENGRKWEILKNSDQYGDFYTVEYSEYTEAAGWQEIKMGSVERWSKEAIEWEFDCEVA